MGSGGGGSAPAYSSINNPSYGRPFVTQNPLNITGSPTPYRGPGSWKFGPGQYDFYVPEGTVDVPNELGGKPQTLTKYVQYALSKEGKPIVDEANAKAQREADLISGTSVDLLKKRNQQQDIKRGLTPSGAGAGNANANKPAAQETILTGVSGAAGSILGASGQKTLLGG